MTELLPSWNETPTRAAIIDFVTAVTTDGHPQFVAPEARVATFDNDGTLWCEKPMPIQLDFTLHRLAELADADASLRTQQPYQAAYEKDVAWLAGAMVKHYKGDDRDMLLLVGAIPKAFAGISVEAYDENVAAFFETATHPTLERPYRACGYQPMVELMRYLEANGFTVYIASGGDRDFMRAVAKAIYGIPPERVIGSSMTLDYQETDEGTDVLYKAEMEFLDDGPQKPIRIWSRIGRRPLIAVGNSNGDVPMLRFARTAQRDALRLLLLHDDKAREFDYTDGAEVALARARERGWTVISIKDDWSTVFAGE
jgi:phosphoserine phosphatase